MESIFEAINEWLKELLIGAINGNLSNMFGDVNEKVGTIAAQAGQTPQGWNGGVFSMIQNLSQTVILPIAGLVITYVLCVELISMVTDKNSLHDIDTFMFFKYVFKAWVAVYLVTHVFDITMAVFDVGQHLVIYAADRLSCIKPLSGKSPVEIQKEARTAAKTEKKPSIRAQLAQDKEALKNAPKKAAEKTKKQDLERS